MADTKVSDLLDGSPPQGTDEIHIARAGADKKLDISTLLSRSNHTGEEQTADIADGAVTYAKIQDVSATDKLLGRSTAGAGDVEEITCTSFARDVLDDADAATARTTLDAAASSHTHDPTTDVEIGSATAGNQLTVNEAGTALEYGLASKYLLVRKATAGTIAAGRPVYIDSYNPAGYVEVEEADASSAATMPAVGLTYDSITNGGSGGRVLISGNFTGLDTSSFSEGDAVYVSTTAGELTATKPVAANLIQKIGQVGRSDASNGQLVVSGAGRSNDIPNFTAADKFWYGGTDGVSTEGDLGTGVVTALAVNVGSAGAVVTNGGALGTPSSGTLTNATGLPLSTGITGALGADLDFDGNNIADSGVLFQREQAAADGDVTNQGQWWTKTATPNLPYFTADDGTDLSLGRMWYTFFLGANDFVATANETRLQWTAPAAGKIWAVAAAANTNVVTSSLQMDVEKNDETILTGTLEILTSTKVDDNGHSIASAPLPTSFAAADVLDFDIDQFDSGGGGAGVHIDLLISWD